MQRETINFVTPIEGKVIVLKRYITGREKRELNNFYFDKNVSYDAETKNVSGFGADLANRVQNESIKLCVVSVDGKKEGDSDSDGVLFSIIDAILDLNSSDYDAVIAQIDLVIAGKSSEEKKTK